MLKQKISNQFFSSDEEENKQYSELLSDSGSTSQHNRDFPNKYNNHRKGNMQKGRNKKSQKSSEEQRERVQIQLQVDKKRGNKFSSEIIPGQKYPKDSEIKMQDNTKSKNQNNILYYNGRGYAPNTQPQYQSIFQEDQELNMEKERQKIKNNCLKTKYSYNQDITHEYEQKQVTNRYKDILRSAHSSKNDNQSKLKNQEKSKIGLFINKNSGASEQGISKMQELSKIEPSNYYNNMTSFNISLTMNSESKLGNSIVNTFEKVNKLCLQKQEKQKPMPAKKQSKKKGKKGKYSESSGKSSGSQSSDGQTLVQHSQQLLDMTKIMNESMVVNITPKRKHEIYEIEQQQSDWQSVSEDRNNYKKQVKKQVKASKLEIKNEGRSFNEKNQAPRSMKKAIEPSYKAKNNNGSKASEKIFVMQQQSKKRIEKAVNSNAKEKNLGKQKKSEEQKQPYKNIGMYLKEKLNQETICQFEQNFTKYYLSKPAFHKVPRIKMLDFLAQLCQLIITAKEIDSKRSLQTKNQSLFALGVQISNNFEQDRLVNLKEICTKYYNGSYFEVGPRREVFKQIKAVIEVSRKFL